ncbi:MAG: hypothetical protein K2J18_08990 [Paramuribaculum sp.]|nr:hypothetical protein [Paramuribaculum sp.]
MGVAVAGVAREWRIEGKGSGGGGEVEKERDLGAAQGGLADDGEGKAGGQTEQGDLVGGIAEEDAGHRGPHVTQAAEETGAGFGYIGALAGEGLTGCGNIDHGNSLDSAPGGGESGEANDRIDVGKGYLLVLHFWMVWECKVTKNFPSQGGAPGWREVAERVSVRELTEGRSNTKRAGDTHRPVL